MRRRREADPARGRRNADGLTRRRCVTDATPTHHQRLALHAQLFGLSSKSFPHLAIQPTRRFARFRVADASPMRRERVADATTTHRRRVADATPMRHRRDADASPTPCLTRLIAYHFLTLPSNQRDASRPDVSQIRHRRVTRRVADASPTHCRHLALDAPLLSVSSTSSHPKRLVARRQRRVADATRRRRVVNTLRYTPHCLACLRHHFLTSPSNHRDNATHRAPTKRRRITDASQSRGRRADDATRTRR